MRVMMVSPGLLKGCEAQNGTRIISKGILTLPLILMRMVGMMVDLVREWRSALIGLLQTSKRIWGARLPNAPMSLESGDVGLKFQLKMLEVMDSSVASMRGANKTKLVELLMMQGSRPSSSRKKLAKANMPSIFMGLGKERKVNEFVLGTDFQRPRWTIRSP